MNSVAETTRHSYRVTVLVDVDVPLGDRTLHLASEGLCEHVRALLSQRRVLTGGFIQDVVLVSVARVDQ